MPRWTSLGQMLVRDARRLVVDTPVTVRPTASMEEVLTAIVSDPRTRHIYVTDRDGVLLGAIRMNVVVEYLFPLVALAVDTADVEDGRFATFRARTAAELMNPEPRFVTESTRLSDLAAIFMEEKINELPVIDAEHRVIGQVNVHEVIVRYLEAIRVSGGG